MFSFKKKNYLKRTDFINSVDSNKIWAESMTILEIKELLLNLENQMNKYDFDIDKNFIMNSRRKTLKSMIEEQLVKSEKNSAKLLSGSLFNFWEFVGDEYPGNIISDCKELGISMKDFIAMDNVYRKKDIICLQEKEEILEMIKIMLNYINNC